MKEYLLSLSLWFRGIRWLWTREIVPWNHGDAQVGWYFVRRDRRIKPEPGNCISYKEGWGPWRFLPLYLTDYLLAVLLGRGVQSLSRAFKLFSKHHYGHAGPLLWGSLDLWASR